MYGHQETILEVTDQFRIEGVSFDISCHAANDGIIDVFIEGGSENVSITWDGPVQISGTGQISGLPEGLYK